MIISSKFFRNILICQSVVEISLGSLVLGTVGLLPVPDFFVEFLGIDLGHVLHHDCDVFGVKKTFELSIVSCVLEDDSFAKETCGVSTQNVSSLF